MTDITVSVIATVYNEYGSLPAWCAALEHQTRNPDEVVIVDGGSTDGTWEYLSGRSWSLPVELASVPGASISEGRNHAIKLASSNIIAVTDAGTTADPAWLERLIAPFVDETVDVVSGFFSTASDGIWNRSLGATTLPAAAELEPGDFQPSSRSVAFRRGWFDLGFAYPEWLDYCEDLVLDLALRRAGARFELATNALVTFEPRPSWKQFFVQYYRYARGDGKAGLFFRRHVVRYATYLVLAVGLKRRRPLELAGLVLLGGLYVRRPFVRLQQIDRRSRVSIGARLAGFALIPIHRLVGDIAKMIGYPVGVAWRLRRFGLAGIRINWKRLPPH